METTMATTIETFVSDGSKIIYDFTFDYIQQSFVKVRVNGTEVEYTLTDTFQVTLDAAPNAGDVIEILRETPSDRLVTFVDGSVLVAANLNLADLQSLHVAEEARDRADSAVTAQASNEVHTSRASLEAATVPDSVRRVSCYGPLLTTVNPLIIDYVEDPNGTALTTNGGTRTWSPADGIANVVAFGANPTSGGDDLVAVQAAIDWALRDNFNKTIYFPTGRYRVSDTIRIDIARDQNAANPAVENLIIRGEGSRSSTGSDLRFDFDDPTKNGFEIFSAFMVSIKDMSISGQGRKNNLVMVNAEPDPNFSGQMMVWENIQFRNFDPCTEAVVHLNNRKGTELVHCYIAVDNPGETSMILGGNDADNTFTFHAGSLASTTIRSCYIWGKVKYRQVNQLMMDSNTWVEGFNCALEPDGDGKLFSAEIVNNYFADQPDANADTPIVISASTNGAGKTRTGGVRIIGNRFRGKATSIDVAGDGPVYIAHNGWELPRANQVGVRIRASAKEVYVGPNMFDQLLKFGTARAILDERNVLGTDEPTEGLSENGFIDFTLNSDNTGISGVNDTTKVGEVDTLYLEGGMYEITMCVQVRNTDASDDLPFEAWMEYRDEFGVTHDLGIKGYGKAPSTSSVFSTSRAFGTLFIQRTVFLPATSSGNPTNSALQLWVKNIGTDTPATGNVEGNLTELGGQAITWFQARRVKA